jgi:hypothetical protein
MSSRQDASSKFSRADVVGDPDRADCPIVARIAQLRRAWLVIDGGGESPWRNRPNEGPHTATLPW